MNRIIAEEYAADLARREAKRQLEAARLRREKRILDALFDRGEYSDKEF